MIRHLQIVAFFAIAALASPAAATAQLAPRDSAALLAKQANVAFQSATPDGIRTARDLWARAARLYAVASDSAGEAEVRLGLGSTFNTLLQPDSALTVYRVVLAKLPGLGADRLRAKALSGIATALNEAGRPDSVLPLLRASLVIHRQLGDSVEQFESLQSIATVFWRRGALDSALAYSAWSLRFAGAVERGTLANALTGHGLFHHQLGRLDSARVHYHSALTISRETKDKQVEARVFNNLAGTFADVGEVDSSLHYFRAALARREEIQDRGGAATTLDNIGVEFSKLGQLDSALTYGRRALALARMIGNQRIEGYVLPSLADVFSALGNRDSALTYQLAGLKLMRSRAERLYEANLLSNMGTNYWYRGDTVAAVAYQDSALALARELGKGNVAAQALHALGSMEEVRHGRNSAAPLLDSALASARRNNDRFMEGRILGTIALSYHRAGPTHLDRAVAYYDSSARVRSFLIRRAGADLNQVSFSEQFRGLFADWTRAWLARSEMGKRALSGALGAAERGRSQALLNLMRRAASPTAPGSDLVADGERLIAGLQATGTTALVYQVVRDTLLIWTIRPDVGAEVSRVAIAWDSLATLIGELRRSVGAVGVGRMLPRGVEIEAPEPLSQRPIRSWSAVGADLGSLIIPPEVRRRIAGVSDLLIVPSGTLAMIPFGALPVGPDGAPLAAGTAVRYAPSLTVLLAAEARPSPGMRRDSNALVVGNPKMPVMANRFGELEALAALPGAEAEARDVAARLGAELLTGNAASEGQVRRRLVTARLVHLATHGFAFTGDARARQSFIAFSADSGQDGRLTVGELLDDAGLNITADLIVLSACQTGLGDISLAEGTIGLQRAFLAKGARSVLVSLWNVSDDATRELMGLFYKHWLEDADQPGKAEALRRAQTGLRAMPRFEHPRYWAGFQLVGAN